MYILKNNSLFPYGSLRKLELPGQNELPLKGFSCLKKIKYFFFHL